MHLFDVHGKEWKTLFRVFVLGGLAVVLIACGGGVMPDPTIVFPMPATVSAEVAVSPASHDIWRPLPATSWQIQLSGPVDPSVDAQVYDIDLFDTPQQLIDQLHAQGRKVICYFSAGSWENWRPDADRFPREVLGRVLEGWPDEKWLDVRRLDLLDPLMQARLDLAVQKGCDAVDPDNVDGYANKSGFPLSGEDQLVYNRWLADQAHRRGLSIGLKNDLGQIPELLSQFDWAINEQCFQYEECELLLPFVQAGKPVFGIEYELAQADFCPLATAMNFDFLKKRLELDAWRVPCR